MLVDSLRVMHRDDLSVGKLHAFLGTHTATCPTMFWPLTPSILEARITRTGRENRFPSAHFPVMSRLRLASHELT